MKQNTDYYKPKTQKVAIGNILLGGNNRLIVQSMTNTDTLDTEATIEQCIRIIEAGADMVRISVQGEAEAKNLQNIKSALLGRGFTTPISADVHYSPKVAELAAQFVEKVRINPGNYAENNTRIDFTAQEYQQALDKTAVKLMPLIAICKKNKTAIRIGVNHGSLSNRIMNKYGNTALGMVESALEFVQLFEDAGFYDLVISLKSSHVLTMVQSNRLLAARMKQRDKAYPIHLGVTEAGNGPIGRQKSIAGIATLLQDGIGDTLRVSLTEAPENEIPLAIQLRNAYPRTRNQSDADIDLSFFNPFEFHKRESAAIGNIGGKSLPVIITLAAHRNSCKVQQPILIGDELEADYLFLNSEKPIFFSSNSKYIQNFEAWEAIQPNCYPLLNRSEFLIHKLPVQQIAFVRIGITDLNTSDIIEKIQKSPSIVLVLSAESDSPIREWHNSFRILHQHKIKHPVILERKLAADKNDAFLLEISQAFAPLLIDGLGDGIWVRDNSCIHLETIKNLSYGILQACRLRLTTTDYIACPSCARTHFNIENRLNEIRKQTKQLKHLKLAIMGCVVNGLGEMADADYGYVGSGIGKVNIYKGKTLVHKNIAEEEATAVLIDLIKAEGDWKTE